MAKVDKIWLTRDCEESGLSEIIEIWNSRPDPTCNEGIVIWFHSDGPTSRMTVEHARLNFRTIPDYALECIRIG